MVRGHPCPHPGSEGHSSDPLSSADLWSAGIPARMGGVVGCCDMDGASMREAPTPYAWLPLRRERE